MMTDKIFQEFKHRIDRKLDVMNDKIVDMKTVLDGLHEALDDFRNEMHLFIDFASEQHPDGDKRTDGRE